MAFNTGNPVGSTDPRDLIDNSGNLDQALNSDELSFQDRLGRSRLTFTGVMANAVGLGNTLAGAIADVEAARSDAEQSAAEALASANTAVAVVTGGTASLVPEAGKIPIGDGEGAIPATWMPEAMTRQELALPASTAQVGGVEARDLSARSADEVYFDALSYGAGALPPAGKTTSTHPYTATVATTGSGYAISGGFLTATSGLAYLHTAVSGGIVREYRANMMWSAGGAGDDQVGVLIVADDIFQKVSGVQTYANAAAHILIYRDRFIYQKRSAGGASTNVLFWQYDAPLELDKLHSFVLTFDGLQIKFVDGKGKAHTITPDADVKDWWGKHATIETVASSGAALKIKSFKVSSAVVIDAAQAAAGAGTSNNLGKGSLIKSPGTINTAIGEPYTIVKTLAIVVPESKVIAVYAMPNLSFNGTGLLYAQFDVEGHPDSLSQQVIAENEPINGVRTLLGICDLSAFTAGQNRTLNMRFATTGAATYRELTSSPPRRVPIVVMPVSAVFA